MKAFYFASIILASVLIVSACNRRQSEQTINVQKFDIANAINNCETGSTSEFFDEVTFLPLKK